MERMQILIVDDEKLERRGIRMLLEGCEGEFLITEAHNGKEACRILDETPTDILITDIKMPFMNGIELAGYARKTQPDIEIIIFSGYGEFEFAKQAMRYGVVNYVLKPVDPDEFYKTLEEVLGRICEKKQQRELLTKSRDDQEKYFLGKYLYYGDQELLNKIRKRISTEGWMDIRGLLLIESEDNFFEVSEEAFIETLSGATSQRLEFLNLSQKQELCMLKSKCSQRVLAEELYEKMNNSFQTKFYMAVSRTITSVQKLPEEFQKLDTLMESRFYRKKHRIFYAEPEQKKGFAEQDLGEMLDQMMEDIRLEDIQSLWMHYELLKGKAGQIPNYSQIYTKFMFSNLIKEFYSHKYMNAEKLEEAIQKVYEYRSIDEVLCLIESLTTALEQNLAQNGNGLRDEVAWAKSYIYEHYEEDISIEKLAELVYLSPGYFSHTFKKETGVNLTRFVREYRIEKAKELLKTTNKKIVQICKETGFTNASYFCKNFREYCGVSPEQFRKGEAPDGEAQTKI